MPNVVEKTLSYQKLVFFLETPGKFIIAMLWIRKCELHQHIISSDHQDMSLQIESFTTINFICSVSTKLDVIISLLFSMKLQRS